jgi:ribosome recycling factor
MFDEIKQDIEIRMTATVNSTKSDLFGIRAGRASPSMLDSIRVDVYGQKMPINQIGNITTPDSRTINVEIWDQSNVSAVEKVISESDLGINPQ